MKMSAVGHFSGESDFVCNNDHRHAVVGKTFHNRRRFTPQFGSRAEIGSSIKSPSGPWQEFGQWRRAVADRLKGAPGINPALSAKLLAQSFQSTL